MNKPPFTPLRWPSTFALLLALNVNAAPLNLHMNNTSVPTHRDRLCANTGPQRDRISFNGPADVLDHATSEIGIGSKLGIDATKKLPGEGFKRSWPPLIKMDESVRKKVDTLFGAKT